MPAHTRTRAQIEYDRRRIAALLVAGATELDCANEIGQSWSLAHYDCRVLRQQWRREAAADIAQERANLLAECRQARREVWEEWRDSGGEREVVTTKQRRRGVQLGQRGGDVPVDSTSEASKRTETRHRNPSYLDTLKGLMEFEARLLGVATQVDVHHSGIANRDCRDRL